MKLTSRCWFPASALFLFLSAIQSSFSLRWSENQLYDLEGTGSEFIVQANLWNATRLVSTQKYFNCNGTYLLGGTGVLGKTGTNYTMGEYFEREYTSLPSHNMIIVNLIFYKLDSWDTGQNDHIKFQFDGITLETWRLAYGQSFETDICGSVYPDYPNIKIAMTVSHIASSIKMKVIDNLSQDSYDESFGIRDINMIFINSPTPTTSFCGSSSFPLPDRACPCLLSNQFKSTDGSCQSCHSSCATCNGLNSTNCLTCPVNKYMNNLNQCVDCAAPCAVCQVTPQQCARCLSGWLLVDDHTCVQDCDYPLIQSFTDSVASCSSPCGSNQVTFPDRSCQSTCGTLLQEQAIGSFKVCKKCPNNTMLNIIDESCKVCNSMKIIYTTAINNNGHRYKIQLSPSSCILDVQTVIANLLPTDDTKILFPTFFTQIQKTSSSIFLMDIIFDGSVLKQTDLRMTLDYLSATATVPKTMVPSAAIQKIAEYAPAAQSLMTGVTSVSIGGAFAFGAMAIMWPLINFQQFIGYFVYINVNYPLQVELFFSLFSFANFNFLPNPLASYTEDLAENILHSKDTDLLETYQPPAKFRKKEETSFFIENGASNFLASLCLFVLLAFTNIIMKFCRMKVPFARAIDSTLKWNFILRAFLENGIPITLTTLLQLRKLSFDNAYTIICGFLAILAFLYIIIMTLFVIQIASMINPETRKKKHITQQYGTLYEGMSSENDLAKYYHLFHLLRGFLLIFLIVFLENHPRLQIIPLIIVNLILVSFLFQKNLFEKASQNFVNRLKEILITVAEICILMLSVEMESESYPQTLGWLIIAALGIAMLFELAYIVVNQIKEIKIWCRKMKILLQVFIFECYERWKIKQLKTEKRSSQKLTATYGDQTHKITTKKEINQKMKIKKRKKIILGYNVTEIV